MNDSERLDKLIDLAGDVGLCISTGTKGSETMIYLSIVKKIEEMTYFIDRFCSDENRHVEGGRE